jgi:hypothetical protein
VPAHGLRRRIVHPPELVRIARCRGGWYYDPRVSLASAVGFAGLYVDTDQTPVILLVDPARADAARREVGLVLELDTTTARIKSAKYDFAQLATWKNVMNAVWAAVPQVTGLGIQEDHNAISVGVSTMDSADSARAFAVSSCVPADAVLVVELPPFKA